MNMHKRLFLALAILVMPISMQSREQSSLRPDEALHQTILLAPLEQPEFPEISTLAHTSMLQGQEANAAFTRLSRKRKAVEAFEAEHKKNLSGKGKNALTQYRNDLIKAANNLHKKLTTISNLLTTAEKQLQSTMESYKRTIADLQERHNETSQALALEAPVQCSVEARAENQANQALEAYEDGPETLFL